MPEVGNRQIGIWFKMAHATSHSWHKKSLSNNSQRVGWVDIAKGLCIVLVVMLHATHGVENAMGQTSTLSAIIAWAAPFRMPDFFLISGLFLASRIHRPWRSYLDTKVVHFVYFYVLWVTIQIAFKAPHFAAQLGWEGLFWFYLKSFIVPFSSLWFIYILAVYFVVAKLVSPVPKPVVFVVAAAMHLFVPATGIFAVDQLSERFVFFYTGYAAAPLIFAFAKRLMQMPELGIGLALGLWGSLNAWAVSSGAFDINGLNLLISFCGIAAVIAFAVALMDTLPGRMLSYCGKNSISIYLSFAIFMATTREILVAANSSLNLGLSVDLVSLSALAAGVIAPLILARMVRNTKLAFLFERPEMFRLKDRPRVTSVRSRYTQRFARVASHAPA